MVTGSKAFLALLSSLLVGRSLAAVHGGYVTYFTVDDLGDGGGNMTTYFGEIHPDHNHL